jgi:hypothetical protein
LAAKKIESLDQFVSRVEKINTRWNDVKKSPAIAPWFRGAPDIGHQLAPGLYRAKSKDYVEEENENRREFQLRGYPFLSEALYHPRTAWDWYFLMQHFGLKTRLLDWTESALVALYFATGESRWRGRNPKSKCDAVVWVMNPWLFNHRYGFGEDRIPSFEDPVVKPYLDDYFKPSKPVTWPDRPLAFEPPHNSLRLAAQRGKFTIHGKSRKSLNVFSDDEDVFVKIVINGKERDWVRQQLGRAGITEGTLYPGLEGLSRDIDDYLADAIVP